MVVVEVEVEYERICQLWQAPLLVVVRTHSRNVLLNTAIGLRRSMPSRNSLGDTVRPANSVQQIFNDFTLSVCHLEC